VEAPHSLQTVFPARCSVGWNPLLSDNSSAGLNIKHITIRAPRLRLLRDPSLARSLSPPLHLRPPPASKRRELRVPARPRYLRLENALTLTLTSPSPRRASTDRGFGMPRYCYRNQSQFRCCIERYLVPAGQQTVIGLLGIRPEAIPLFSFAAEQTQQTADQRFPLCRFSKPVPCAHGTSWLHKPGVRGPHADQVLVPCIRYGVPQWVHGPTQYPTLPFRLPDLPQDPSTSRPRTELPRRQWMGRHLQSLADVDKPDNRISRPRSSAAVASRRSGETTDSGDKPEGGPGRLHDRPAAWSRGRTPSLRFCRRH
jgi:hypothetical protein